MPENRGGAGGEVLTLEEAAAYLRVSPDAVVSMVDAEGLPARRFGPDWRFHRGALQAWLSAARPNKGILAHIGRIAGDPFASQLLDGFDESRGRNAIEPG